MSRYLVERIRGLANVEVVRQAQVTALEGRKDMLEAVRWRLAAGTGEVRRPVQHLFLFIGAEPNSNWLAGALKLDRKGFILTGPEAGGTGNF
jgi:thioredoxin reductase (NADPH)